MEWIIIYLVAGALIIPVFIYGLIAQSKVNSTFDKYSKAYAKNGITAAELAHKLLHSGDITNVNVEKINGNLTDCYDSKNKVLKLSSNVYNSSSIAALGVCAHEVGHALQDKQKSFMFRLRLIVIPFTNFISRAFIPLIFIGAILNSLFFLPSIGYYITLFSVITYGGSLLVYFVTLPLEYDASKKAIALLESTGTLDETELPGARKVLVAAIHTYVAAFLSSLIYFLRFLSIIMMFRDRD